jgi:micrococcal nuclease
MKEKQSWIRIGVAILTVILGALGFVELSRDQQELIEEVISEVLREEIVADGTVTRVVDGDTLKVSIGGEEQTIRLIGVDTPESVDPRRPVECFGKEASEFVKGRVEGKQVKLVTDSTQSDRDRYDRLLRYVYVGDEMLNREIIAQGYGFEYTVGTKHLFADEFRELEEQARNQEIGLWSTETCAKEYQ